MQSSLAAVAILLHSVLIILWWSTPAPLPPILGKLQIDINQASPQELSILPQVGPVLARRIVENRTRLGDFAEVRALDRVHGIGQQTLRQISPYCVAGLTPNTDQRE
ncbi:MAG: helix-hairpin-helix domain-containing protein [Rubripirellula sp.]|nr:helix-hairpin-helix domain-containing protein [Rubripirellula sp.]